MLIIIILSIVYSLPNSINNRSLFVKSNLQAFVDGTPCGRGTDGYEWDYCDPEAQQSTSTATVTSTSSTATATTVTKTWPTTTT